MSKIQKPKIKILLRKSYLAMIQNSKGTKMFTNFYGENKGQIQDLTENGKLSCAYFVSSVLKIFGLIKGVHLTVKSTVKDLEKTGWYLIEKPKPGSVLLWEKKAQHFHVGFYLGKKLAISNISKTKKPSVHHWTYNNKRKVLAIYWHKKLDKE